MDHIDQQLRNMASDYRKAKFDLHNSLKSLNMLCDVGNQQVLLNRRLLNKSTCERGVHVVSDEPSQTRYNTE